MFNVQYMIKDMFNVKYMFNAQYLKYMSNT